MDFAIAGEDLPLLQLHRWAPSQFQFNLSEFHEAFISPTKELLLLLSYQCEALLLPLVSEAESVNGDVFGRCSNSSENQSSGAICEQLLVEATSSGSKVGASCTSASVVDFDNGFSCEHEKPCYSYISNVNSLAWGVCGDTYDQHNDPAYRQLLFISNGHGVTVHAFLEPDKTNSSTHSTLGAQFGEGKWVDWGPSSESAESMTMQEACDQFSDVSGNDVEANGNREFLHSIRKGTAVKELPRDFSSKRWLHSFFTKAETIQSDGRIWTRFPEKQYFPSSAKVVSFSLFDTNLPVMYFLSCGNSNKENCSKNLLDAVGDSMKNNPNCLCGDFCVDSYRCSRVFSSNSYCLIGFVLTLVDSSSINSTDKDGRSKVKYLIVVARLRRYGIQWVSLVKLEDIVNQDSVSHWVDFCFSDNLLVCLNASGVINFYCTKSGNFVSHVNILEACGVNPHTGLRQQEMVPVAPNSHITEANEIHDQETSLIGKFFHKRNFRKLLVASHNSLLAAVDDCGVIYTLFADDYLPENYYPSEKWFSNSRYLGLGTLIGWRIGGSDVGHQSVSPNKPSVRHLGAPLWDYGNCNVRQAANIHGRDDRGDLSFSRLSTASRITTDRFNESGVNLHFMRNVFIPTERLTEDDCVCLSPLGITCFIKKHTDNKKTSQIVHFKLHKDSTVHDDRYLNPTREDVCLGGKEDWSVGEVIGCTFQGCLYLVSEDGLSVVLPSISISSNFLPVETIGYRQHINYEGVKWQLEAILDVKELKKPFCPWKVELLDRVLIYEGAEGADWLSLQNGWDLKISRLRRLQLALDYLKFDEIEHSLEMLVDVNLAEEGILRLLFAAVYLMVRKFGTDNEVSAASRLLGLATCFATQMIRKYGILQRKKRFYPFQGPKRIELLSLPPNFPCKVETENGDSRRICDMAHLLEMIRNLQCRLTAKFMKPGQGIVDGKEPLSLVTANLEQDESQFLPADSLLLETQSQQESLASLSPMHLKSQKLALVSKESPISGASLEADDSNTLSSHIPQVGNLEKVFTLENPKEMIARWKLDNLDLKTVVKDALHTGRLPLAVLQLHLYHRRDLETDKEPPDTFTEVRDIGRTIAYDLFLKGETGLAISTLQRLGEDIEACLRQLLFGTVRRHLRIQVAEEMKRYGYLGPYEGKILERILLIERLYPSSSFWKTYAGRQKALTGDTFTKKLPNGLKLHILHSHQLNDLIIDCGELDGVVLGSWASIHDSPPDTDMDEDIAHVGYWVAAAVWSNAWDQQTIDRIVLDQPFLLGVHVLWESQLEYYACHNDWEELSKLVDHIPASVLSNRSLQIALVGLSGAPGVGLDSDFRERGNLICSIDDFDVVCMDVPGIKILKSPVNLTCTVWLRVLLEQELAKKFVFLKEYWEGTADIVTVLARSGFITSKSDKMEIEHSSVETSLDLDDFDGERSHVDAVQALHKLFVYHCVQYGLPNLLDLYLDHHKLGMDNNSLHSLLEAAGDCQWAKWLLLSRVKGYEYDASFSNARSIMSCNIIPESNLSALRVSDIICTVDDIAEGGGELAALATLMYAPCPIQNCLSSGGINRRGSISAQCTLENLRPTLQRFPTLWRTLVAARFGQDTASNYLRPKADNALVDYLNWRDNIFYSAARDTSLLQMLPCWFPKTVRRLIHLYMQGPLGWQSLSGLPTGDSLLHREIDFCIHADEQTEIGAVSWEATIQKHVQDELYDSSLEESGVGIEHHLHRGRALAAFNHILGVRVQKLKLEGKSGASHGQSNVQSDVQTLLAPLTQNEEALLSSVIPLAVTHFEDSVLVASCAFLLELCGLSASMLRVDVAALRRISSFYKLKEKNDKFSQFSPKGSTFHLMSHEGDMVESLAQSLADEYLHADRPNDAKLKRSVNSLTSKQSSRALMLILQNLEKASLPVMMEGNTCGSWLLTGCDDGTELRAQQKVASQYWSLVTIYCQMHQLPLSTKYLALLARDNDWVGFLSEAQIGGYPFDSLVQIASREFSDPRLRVHILTVLKSMHSKKKAGSTTNSDMAEKRSETSCVDANIMIPAELFKILADCEKLKYPGEALLKKAKEMSWAILAVIASCFPDVSPLSCLSVWLEITAARETSSIKVNDIASQIADNVRAAVEATNSLTADNRGLTFHYNRQNSKRRRLMEPISGESLVSTADVSSSFSGAKVPAAHGVVGEREGMLDTSAHGLNIASDPGEGPASLSNMVAVLCEQKLFLPLLRAFEMFLPSCSLLPFIRALQAFSQMRLSEASAHLGSFANGIKPEPSGLQSNVEREAQTRTSWICSTAVKAADAILSTCPSPYEKRCLLQLLAATDFGDGGSAAAHYRRLYWKINLAEPLLHKDEVINLGDESLDDASLLTALEKNGHWDKARNWARQLEASGGPWKSAFHHVTETQAESMVAEWKEFLWDVPEERVALWGHCQTLFIRYGFPPLQAGTFFLKHAEAVEKDIPAKELLELLFLSLQWLSGLMTVTSPVYPMHLLREIETRVWLLAVESEAQLKGDGEVTSSNSTQNPGSGSTSSIIDSTASLISKMDNHIIAMRNRNLEKYDSRENNFSLHKNHLLDSGSPTSGGNAKTKRRAKGYMPLRRALLDPVDKGNDLEDFSTQCLRNELQLQDENVRMEMTFSKWEEKIGPAELERAVLSLLEFGQTTAAKQLQHKLSPEHTPPEFKLVDVALKLAAMSTPVREVSLSILDEDVLSVMKSYNISIDEPLIKPLQILESLTKLFAEGSGCGLCKRIIAVVKAANVLGLSFSEAFNKQPIELLQLLSLKAQESFEEASLLVQTCSMPAAKIAQILAESFLKGLLAAHRGGYMDSQKEEGPAPLLWRFSDFLKWAELCPSEPEIGHALMRLVITGQEIPHACEVELLILSHHFYKSSACLDGVDVLIALAATRVEAYVSEGDFPCLARLITGVGNFHALIFILGILIENGQLDLLLQKFSAAADTDPGKAVRGFRMAVLTSLKHFNARDLDAFAMVYNHFDMKHETAALLESRAWQSADQWFHRYDKDQNEDLLESMRFYIEAAEVYSSIDAGNKTRGACAQASLVSLQIRMPDSKWLNLTETNARRLLVEQSRFQEALIVAEAYGLNQPGEWALVLWNQMLNPELTEEFVAEFVAVLPFQPSMLVELARFYRAEVVARGDQSQFSVWLTGGGLPAEWAKYLGRSFRCLLKRTRDLRLRLQLAAIATGFTDVMEVCTKMLDKVPDNAGPLVLRKGHGGAYLPLM
ncbi:hypothetical protein K2173_005158 [Erythroxylum novogranatense]|uniref:Spatacsin C-terminal domain-containing protein n=1 Tax=Erythroxylum novogranatense TaxID=1862640 RepID=A0AAV8TRH9_9ROSI|nr:hypothetical protein K2173_005158 [Erythroxylum novogranatense]